MTPWRDDIFSALTNLGGQASLKDLYQEVKRIRVDELPTNVESTIRFTLQAHCSSSSKKAYKGGADLFRMVPELGRGYWAIRDVVKISFESPGRAETVVQRIIRDTAVISSLKLLHYNRCQICGLTIESLDGETYSEGHHIRPLGSGHNGPDIEENVIIVCPNCHICCDRGFITIDTTKMRLHPEHMISEEHVSYHNKEIVKARLDRLRNASRPTPLHG